MISAIVLAPDLIGDEDTVRLAEIVVRSLTWLVSAVVAGVVRDVTLAAPSGLGLGDLADQAGCELVQAEAESIRLAAALAKAQQPVVLIVRAGFIPENGLIAEIDDLLRHDAAPKARLLEAPKTFLERVFPDRARTLGVLLPKTRIPVSAHAPEFRRLVQAGGSAKPFRHRAYGIG